MAIQYSAVLEWHGNAIVWQILFPSTLLHCYFQKASIFVAGKTDHQWQGTKRNPLCVLTSVSIP